MRRNLILAWLVAILPASLARGDGCMFVIEEVGESRKLAASPKQEAVLIRDGRQVRVILRTHFRAGPKELAWVVPVPAKPTNIDKGDDRVFAELDDQTAPKFFFVKHRPKPLHLACTCAGNFRGGDGVKVVPPVVVEATGTAGIFEYTVLSARKADKLVQWLNDHRYYVPAGAAPVFDRYVKGGWYWLAMRIRPEITDRKTLAPHPVTYSYTDDKLVYPLVISRISADRENEIILYVLAEQRFACANWSNATSRDLADPNGRFAGSTSSPSGTNYEDRFRSETHRAGGRLFVTEFAADMDTVGYRPLLERITGRDPLKVERMPSHLTRMRAVMTPQSMDRDVELKQTPDAPWVSNQHHLAAGPRAGGQLAIAPLVVICAAVSVLLLGVCLVGRSPWSSATGGLCIFAACTVLTMI